MTNADLLAAIVNNPREDPPRLAYADAIAPSDPARAEFIRARSLWPARATCSSLNGVS